MTERHAYIPVPGPGPADLPQEGAITPPVAVPTAPPQTLARQSLVAAAATLTGSNLEQFKPKRASGEGWQEDAWEMYDLVGELRFLANVLSSQMSKARFYVGELTGDTTEPPKPVDDMRLNRALTSIGDGPAGMAAIIKRAALNMYVAGDTWIIGIPSALLPRSERDDDEAPAPFINSRADIDLDDLRWRAFSTAEVTTEGRMIVVKLGANHEMEVKADPDSIMPIRTWVPHPRRYWEADSPTRSTLPSLREIVGYSMHASAQIDSRLAGAGVILAPESASRAAKRMLNLPEDGPDDPFTDALIKSMMTPIADRANASAFVPLVWTVPDESEPHFRFMDFAKELDDHLTELRDGAIRRFALGADAPPELLLGVSSMNHWGAWLVQEDVVRAHLEPPLALLADAFTTQFLRPVMEELGYGEDVIERTVVWYDVEHLIVRPSLTDDAKAAHQDGIISDEAYRDRLGFSEDDAPLSSKLPAAERAAWDMVNANPSLMANPGLPVIVEQLRALLAGTTDATPAVDEDIAEDDAPVEGDDIVEDDADALPEPDLEPAIAASVFPPDLHEWAKKPADYLVPRR